MSDSVIDSGEKVCKEIDDAISGNVVSAAVYGTDINSKPKKGMDCNLVLVLDRIDEETLIAIDRVIRGSGFPCSTSPLLVETSEIEGMMDSVPVSFLNILVSYHTVYGRSIFKGLSSINHEHLRAQTEQFLREELFEARRILYSLFSSEEEMVCGIERMRALLRGSIQLYYILSKPWLTSDAERRDAFFEDFGIGDALLKRYYEGDLEALSKNDLRKLGLSIIHNGIKPVLKRVDEMGPQQ
ncbi:MAG: hypothetical protein JW939_04370 [Candidatus Thermoplasmatota archaeon]|nr:hypothetical protein [Candidatus Thermoplasmatota archaeon]